jgi:RNA polymerase sigma-70 factor (ECF subfamily)
MLMTIGPAGLQPKDLHVFLFATLLNLRNLTAQGLLLKATGEAVRTLWVWPIVVYLKEVSRRTSTSEVELSATSTSAPRDKVARTTELEIVLIDRVCTGEKELFYELISPYERSVYFAAFSVLQNEADAEEAAQEAFLKAFSHLSSFRRESKFSTWLIQIAVNEARMKRRKDRKSLHVSKDDRDHDEEGDYIPRDFADWREIPSEALDRAELREALQKAIASLRPKYREVFVMRDIQNLNVAETAAALQISEASVKTRLLRARLQMRDALAPGFDGAWSIGRQNWKKVRPW